jgi:hypothetical protein
MTFISQMTVGDQMESTRKEIDVGVILLIQRALASRCQCCDDAEFSLLAQVFAPEGVFGFAGEEMVGRGALAAWFERAQPPRRRGKHFTITADVDVDHRGGQSERRVGLRVRAADS